MGNDNTMLMDHPDTFGGLMQRAKAMWLQTPDGQSAMQEATDAMAAGQDMDAVMRAMNFRMFQSMLSDIE